MIIARGRSDEIVPLEPASMPGGWWCSGTGRLRHLGIIKIDLLGWA